MPYIDANRRLDALQEPMNAGELNYVITNYIWEYYKVNPKYQSINDVVGALEGAKLEFYARVARPYEESKMKLNGDVYV